MSERPLIGIATQTLQAIPGQVPLAWVMGQQYVRALTQAGAIPWVIPLLQDDEATLREIYSRLDGVFLTGGVDVDPSQYGESRHALCGSTDPARDWVELRLVRWARQDHKPILGVCRGIQAINVALGGTLVQDVSSQLPGSIKHDCFPDAAAGYERNTLVHEVRVVKGTRLESILRGRRLPVNSMHHQGLRELASGLAASAFAPDGLIEGVEGVNGQYLVGVQWHPEELVGSSVRMRRLFSAFTSAARQFSE